MTANARIDLQTGKYIDLELNCPFSNSVTVSLTDIDVNVNQDWIKDNLVSLCRKECL